jgi:pyridoxine 5-phosphate synthase
MAYLNVNIDHVATLRQARMVDEPDPVWAAAQCELGGAHGITVHLREDRRHIQDRDVLLLKQTVGVLLNLEMAMAEPVVKIALKMKPDQVTLVPERRQELTTEGGLDCIKHRKRLQSVVKRLKKAGITVSAFIVPDADQVRASRDVGCDAIELHTGMYANAKTGRQITRRLKELENARDAGWENQLVVHAGHGLNYRNIGPIAAIEGLEDFNIGHSIVSRSVYVGICEATREMLALIDKYSD